VVLLGVVLLLAFAAYLKRSIRQLGEGDLGLQKITGMVATLDTGLRANRALGEAAKVTVREYRPGSMPAEERRLRHLQALVTRFEEEHGRLPGTAAELSVQPKDDQCRIIPFETSGYILNCDDWLPPPPLNVPQLTAQFVPGKAKFYVVDLHLILADPGKK